MADHDRAVPQLRLSVSVGGRLSGKSGVWYPRVICIWGTESRFTSKLFNFKRKQAGGRVRLHRTAVDGMAKTTHGDTNFQGKETCSSNIRLRRKPEQKPIQARGCRARILEN